MLEQSSKFNMYLFINYIYLLIKILILVKITYKMYVKL